MFAFVLARRAGRPSWILIVGDLAALLPTMPYRGGKQLLWRGYTRSKSSTCNGWRTDRWRLPTAAALADKALAARRAGAGDDDDDDQHGRHRVAHRYVPAATRFGC